MEFNLDPKKKYYVTSRGYVGNSLLFWRGNNHGYNLDARKARIFTGKEIQDELGNGDKDFIAWPQEEVLLKIQYHFDGVDVTGIKLFKDE